MPISKTPKQEPFPLRYKEEQEPKVNRFSPLPTATDLRKKKLFGIPLKSGLTGEEIDDSSIQFYIDAAISEIEHELDIYITPVTFRERHDYRRGFKYNFAYLKMDHRPILTVSKVELSFDNNQDASAQIDFPLEHVHVMPQEGVIQLVPAFGTSTSGFLLSAFSGVQYHAIQALGTTEYPGAVRVEYEAGFCEDKVPVVINNLIEVVAALALLSELGPVLFPYNSVSIGIDGTSQSTSNPGPKFLNDRIDQLMKEKDRITDVVKSYYHRKFNVDFY